MGGSTDGDIEEMIQSGGLVSEEVGSSVPREIVETLGPLELFPLNLFLPAYDVYHVTLVFRDEDGKAFVYDSDDRDDFPGHLQAEGTDPFTYYMTDESSEWLLAKKFYAE